MDKMERVQPLWTVSSEFMSSWYVGIGVSISTNWSKSIAITENKDENLVFFIYLVTYSGWEYICAHMLQGGKLLYMQQYTGIGL